MVTTRTATIDLEALAKEGIPRLQAEAFAQVAQQQNCIILSRVPGGSCFDLLQAGYDAKSFHIKGKSCNWGPMAGFVCLDPLLNKNGLEGAASNAKCHKKSLKELYEQKTASYTPIKITQNRVDYLLGNAVSDVLFDRKGIQITQKETGRLVGTAENGNLTFSFMLLKRENLWELYYCLEDAYKLSASATKDTLVDAFTNKLGVKFSDKPDEKKGEQEAFPVVAEKLLEACSKSSVQTLNNKRYVPVMAMTNPNAPYPSGKDEYLNAITGDYDLFAIWTLGKNSTDKRVAGMSGSISNDAIVQAEKNSERIGTSDTSEKIGATVGNISERIYLIAQLVNSVIDEKYGKPQPNRVYHSDEGGRPFVKSLDLPVAVFTPDFGSSPVGFIVKEVTELAKYIETYAAKEYTIFVNKGWHAELAGKVKPGVLADSEKI